MDAQEALKIFETVAGQVDVAEQPAFKTGVAKQLGLTATETATTATAETTESPAKADIWQQLSPEEKHWAETTVEAMAEHFSQHFPGQETNFAPLIFQDAEGHEQLAITTVATKGLDLGNPQKTYDAARNWNETLKDKRLALELDGAKLDTRQPVTLPLLKALAKHNPEIYEYVWRTGEPDKAGGLAAPIAYVNGGQAYDYRYYRGVAFDCLRFRPAVVKAR